MKRILFFLLVFSLGISIKSLEETVRSSRYLDPGICDGDKDVILDYRQSLYDIALKLYKKIGERSNFHFVFSPFSIWRILAAIAEGADSEIQQQLFQILRLPNDYCTRLKYYEVTDNRIVSGADVIIKNTRAIVVDKSLNINRDWLNFVKDNSMLDVFTAPIKEHPLIAANYMRQIMSAPLRRLNLNGNSAILDTIEYSGLWSTAFGDAVIQRSPFYDQVGKQIGTVDLMTVKRRVRMGYVRVMNARFIELAAGENDRYRMIFCLVLDSEKNIKPLMDALTTRESFDLFENWQESRIPIEIAIPRFTIMSDIDVKAILEEMGFPNIWTDPAATRYISSPPAYPSSFMQRAVLNIRNDGLKPTPMFRDYPANASTGLDPILGRDFIANRPFGFALLDAETYTFLMSAFYTKPTYT